MATRSKTKERLAHVLQCDIDKDLTCKLALRKNEQWFYISIIPDKIKNDHLRGQYERRADAARHEKMAFQEYCNGEEDSGYESGTEEEDFNSWIQKPLLNTFEQHKAKKPESLKDWYGAEIHCFSLRADDDWEVVSEDLQPPSMTPYMKLPKYISSRVEEWIDSKDVEVIEEEHNIYMPIHPTVVKYKGKTCFLKLVAEGQEPAVKREIKMLMDVKDLDIRAPRLEGVVRSADGIMGFLLQIIPGCVPLSRLMTSEISQSKRDGWAKEVKRQTDILHKNKMLWGDAKADNFLVDEEDKLWIIDFGGSFTVGWVDPDKYGTRRGEDEAVKKIVDGVKDPDHCDLVDETDDKTPSQQKKKNLQQSNGKKRKKDESDTEDVCEDKSGGSKKQKKEESSDN